METYGLGTDGFGTRSSFHYEEPTTTDSKSAKLRVRNAQCIRYRLVEIGLLTGLSTLVESTCFELDERYIQSGTEHDLMTGPQVE